MLEKVCAHCVGLGEQERLGKKVVRGKRGQGAGEEHGRGVRGNKRHFEGEEEKSANGAGISKRWDAQGAESLKRERGGGGEQPGKGRFGGKNKPVLFKRLE